MTGFGNALYEFPNKKIQIDVKVLNGKHLDLGLRIPNFYREKEPEIRSLVASELARGKVELSIIIVSSVPDQLPKINEDVFEDYYTQLNKVSSKLNIKGTPDFVRAVLGLPDVLKTETLELNEEEWLGVQEGIKNALDAVNSYRITEGAALYKDIFSRINEIGVLLSQCEAFEEERLERIKARIRTSLVDTTDNIQIDENRFEQELIYYLEKLDITEEKVRLRSHLDYFKQTMEETGPIGKKLVFISQEIGREINTLGSKANDADIQRLVIQMKDELEKIKEQLLNVL